MPILWRRLDRPGHESARIFSRDSRYRYESADGRFIRELEVEEAGS